MIAIDLGSNTIRILKYDCKTKKVIGQFEQIVRTAQNLHIDGTIDTNSTNRIINAINLAKEKINFDDEIVAYTTEALRQAKNSDEVINTIYNSTKVNFKIIDGQMEAKLVLLAIKNAMQRLNIQSQKFAIVDIGGGSTEVIFNDNDSSISKSFKIGIVTMTNKYINSSIDDMKTNIKKELTPLKEYVEQYLQSNSIDSFISTAGTPTTISAIKHNMTYKNYDPNKINGTIIDTNDVQNILTTLLSLPKEKKEELVGVSRDDLIITGIIILQEIFEILKVNHSIVVDDGLREGIAINYCKKDFLVL